ncbi:MAG: hypothetical protein H7Y33_07905 [Cytophagales bacterium]|nr:hypothetical protein [Rhizobacter sp.]
MLALKLLLVPAFLLLVTLAGKRWGAAVAGWLAGLPVVAGPILFFLAVEHGAAFASSAAALSLSAVLASVAFSVAYSHAAHRLPWMASLVLGLCAWAAAVFVLSALTVSAAWALVISVITLLAAPRLFPAARVQTGGRTVSTVELVCRMLAGASLTLFVTWVASSVGPAWSGLLAVFPILGIVLAVFSHRSQGSAFAAALLRAMATGLYSFVAFCFVLSVALPPLGVAAAFMLATLATLTVQAGSLRRMARLRTHKA